MLNEEHRDSLIPRVHGWILAPTFGLANQVWRELQTFMPKDWIERIDENEKAMYTVDNGIIEVKSTNNPQNLVSVGLDIVLWTEAARSEPYEKMEEAWSNIFTRLQSPGRGPGGKGGHVLINSTPHGLGYYHDLYLMALKDKKYWDVFHWTTMDNPYIRPEDVEKAKKMMTKAQFEQEWLAQFPKEGGEIFPNLDKICCLKPEEPRSNKRYFSCWDPASPRGEDDSLLGVRDEFGNQVWIERLSRKLWKNQHERIAEVCKWFNNAPVRVLKTGIGEQSIEELARLGCNVIPVQETPVVKTNMVMHLSLLCEKTMIQLIDDPFQREQMRIYQSKVLPSGAVSYGAPRHKHDDFVSMNLGLYSDFMEPSQVLPYVGLLLGAKRRG